MLNIDIAPARRVLEEAIATNDALGHDNLGSLSYSHGFLPRTEPLRRLPQSHVAWDQVAEAIPRLFRTYTVRKTLDDMPILSANQADLPDEYLLRASSLFSILAHLYWYSEPEPPENGIPAPIQLPWEQISQRLDRPAPHLAFGDLNSNNWQFIDPTLEQPFITENLRLAIPMVGNEDERRFQMTPVEMLYLFSPLLGVMLNAQEAVLHDDPEALKAALVYISDALKYQTYVSLMKVNPNPYNDLYINPVVWGKTAALFASPFQPNGSVPGPSGTAIPSFTTLDVFFGRRSYKTTVGHETNRTRNWFPKHWRDWLDALEKISMPDYVMQRGDRTLKGIYDEARDTYAGESGMLSRHRLKAYGFLDLSFKGGRVKTLGGIEGSYSERVWDRLASELDESRLERYGAYPQTSHMVSIRRIEPIREHDQQFVRRVVFDISNTGIRYQPGDRCGILPENSDELVGKTLAALHATGSENIQLNAHWRQHVNLRHGWQNATELPLRTLLKFGRIRPVDRSVALNLYGVTNNQQLSRILDHWAEDQWELWDLFALLSEAGYNTRRLWRAIPGDYEHICRVILPEQWRLYSISSVMESSPDELHLTIGGLNYQTQSTDVSHEANRWGTGSSYLARLAPDKPVSIKVVHPPRFSLPQDVTRPVVMLAGGTGIAPMRGLIDARMKTADAGATWLFFGTREPADFYYQNEFEPFVAAGRLNVRVAFSRAEADAQFNRKTGLFEIVPGECGHLDQEMLKPENASLLWEMLCSGAYFYLCGRTAFASTMIETIKEIIVRNITGESAEERDANARLMLYRLIGEERLMLEIFTTYAGSHLDSVKPQLNVSEVVLHNDDVNGYWIIVSGRVYDVNEFNHMHPGGAKIIQSYSGMDATIAYQKIEHHTNPEVDAMLGMYELGVIRTPEFGQAWGVAVSKKGLRVITLRNAYQAWVDLLYMTVEIENAILNDFRVRHEPFTEIETFDNVLLTPAKVEQLGLAHERLVTSYLSHLLGEPIQTLWALTIGLLGKTDLELHSMERTLQRIQATKQAHSAMNLAHNLREQLKRGEMPVEQFGTLCDLLEREDRRMIRGLKLALRDGVKAFEELEEETIRLGGNALINALQSIPTHLESFYAHLAKENSHA